MFCSVIHIFSTDESVLGHFRPHPIHCTTDIFSKKLFVLWGRPYLKGCWHCYWAKRDFGAGEICKNIIPQISNDTLNGRGRERAYRSIFICKLSLGVQKWKLHLLRQALQHLQSVYWSLLESFKKVVYFVTLGVPMCACSFSWIAFSLCLEY